MKLLVILAAVGLLLWLLRSGREVKPTKPRDTARAAAPRIAPPEDMVRCDACGLHLPRSDALVAANGIFCCAAHQRAGPGPQ
ncbi:PP0621 family protein [Xylophilus sp. GW821-FHT01B05]